jgi:hypothetical protein
MDCGMNGMMNRGPRFVRRAMHQGDGDVCPC